MSEFLLYFRALFQHLAILALAIFAWRRGDVPERWAALTMVAMVLLDYLYHFLFPQGQIYRSINYGHLVNDCLILVALGYLALRANRIYPLWMLAAQIISVSMHFNRELSSTMPWMGYLVLTRAPSYIQILALAAGLAAHRRRIRRYGTYRSWRSS